MFPNSTHILVIDDMKGVRFLIIKLLKEIGFTTVSEAENGEEGFAKLVELSKSAAPVGLVIADVRMPVMDGLELLKKVRADANFSKLPYIILTAEAEKEKVVNAIKLGVSEYIIKPTTAPILTSKLKAAWNNSVGKPA